MSIGTAISGQEAPTAATLLLIEDDGIVRAWVRLALRDGEWTIAAEAGSAEAGYQLLGRRHCDLLLIDQHLPDESGTDLLRRMRREGVVLPAVLMTATAEEGLNETARESGFQACVVKQSDPDVLLDVLRRVRRGETIFDAAHPRRPPGVARLSQREREALVLVAHGATNKEAAHELGISDETVKTLLERSYRKLGVRRRAEAVAAAQKRGLI